MNRILSIIISIIFVLSMPAVSVYAADSVSVVIDNPADGSVVENTKFDVTLSTEGNVVETILEFDGTRIPGTTLTEDMLTIGEHTLTAYVVSDGGSVVSDTSSFSVIKSIHSSKLDCDFSDIDTSSANLTASTVKLGTGITCIPQITKSSKATVNIIEGPDGEGDTAVNLTSASSFSSSRPFYRYLIQNGNISTKAVINFDIKVNSATNVLLSYMDTAGTTAYLTSNTGYLFDKSGKILGTDESYTANKWYNVDLTIDVTTDTADLYISHYDEEQETDVTVQILDNAPVNPVVNLTDIRINYHGNANCGFGIDNVSISEEAVFTGIKEISYIYDGEEFNASRPDSMGLSAIKLYMNEDITAKTYEGSVELVNAEGAVVPLSSISYTADDNSLLLTLSDPIGANTTYSVYAHLSLWYSGELLTTDIAAVSFTTAADSYSPLGVDLTVEGTKLIAASQLKGKKLAAGVHFSNYGIDEMNISLVLAVRSGNRLVGLDIVDAVIPAEISDHVINLETDIIPSDTEDITIQLMMIESMTNRVTVFPTYEVKF